MQGERVMSITGNSLVIKVYDDFRFPDVYIGNVENHLRAIKEMHCREDDIFIVAYPKSGNHWVREIVYMLKTQSVEHCPTDEPDFPIGVITMDRIEKLRSPRVFYSHFLFRYLPQEFTDRCGKVITIVRDFRDVVTSYYLPFFHFFKRIAFDLPWEEFLTHMIDGKWAYGCWFDWIEDMEKEIKENPDYPILMLKYEDLLKDLRGEIGKIAEFLEIQIDDKKLTEITQACTFKEMKKVKSQQDIKEGIKAMSLDTQDPLFRKGTSGDWKNIFTVSQYEKVKELMMRRKREGSRFNYLDDH